MVPVWMTSSDLFNVTMIQRKITWKWYNTQLSLQWPINKKSYDLSNVPLSMTLNDPYPQFQGTAVFYAEHLRNGTTYVQT